MAQQNEGMGHSNTSMTQQGTGSGQDERAQAGEVMATEPDLAVAFRVVCQTPKERLLSITLQMGGGGSGDLDPAEQVVQGMALVALGREANALQQLQALADHHIAAYLADQVSASRGRLEEVCMDSFQPPEPRVGTLLELARIFRVLARERLCEASLRDCAYQAALRECKNNEFNGGGEETRHAGGSSLDELIEEVRGACGLEVSLRALQLRSDSPRSLAACSLTDSTLGCPTSLMSLNSSSSSLPSHLEISAAPTEYANPSHTHPQQHTSTHTQPTSTCSTSFLSSTPSSLPSHLEISATPKEQAHSHTHTQHPSTHTQPASISCPPNKQQQTSTHSYGSLQTFTHTPASQPNSTHTQHSPPNSIHTPNSHTDVSSAAGSLVGQEAIGRLGPVSGPHATAATATLAPGPATVQRPAPPHAQCSGRGGTHQLVTSVSTGVEPPCPPEPGLLEFSRSVSAPGTLSSREQEEDGAVFYAFVILHAPEDEAVAEELRERLEVVTSGTGATFSQDFHIPGRHTLSCMDDAINNSAFTILLLTRNFTSRMQEVLTNSALINAIEKRHKYNTVIPLLPKTNPLPPDSQPLALRTLVKLQEGRPSFAHSARKVMGPDRVERQKCVWRQEQEEARLQRNSERIRRENQQRRDQIRQAQQYQQLYQESWELHHKLHNMQSTTSAPPPPFYTNPPSMRAPPAPPPTFPSWPPPMIPYMYWPPPAQPQPNISIRNASCVMIGNNSTMTIGDPSMIQEGLDDEDKD